MELYRLVMLATVLLVCGPAALKGRNLTAAALAGGYFLGEIACLAGLFDGMTFAQIAGNLFLLDITMIAFIFCKTLNACREYKYRNRWHQARCMFSNHTPYDRAILAIFVFGAWPAYVLNIDAASRFWVLWVLAMLQYLLSGAESLSQWRRAKARVTDPDTPSSGALRVAWGWAGDG